MNGFGEISQRLVCFAAHVKDWNLVLSIHGKWSTNIYSSGSGIGCLLLASQASLHMHVCVCACILAHIRTHTFLFLTYYFY